MRVSKSFEARYESFCVVCDGTIEQGDIACFVEDDIAHESCAADVQPPEIKTFSFDPEDWK